MQNASFGNENKPTSVLRGKTDKKFLAETSYISAFGLLARERENKNGNEGMYSVHVS